MDRRQERQEAKRREARAVPISVDCELVIILDKRFDLDKSLGHLGAFWAELAFGGAWASNWAWVRTSPCLPRVALCA